MSDIATNTVNRELGILTFDKLEELSKQKPEIIAMDYKMFSFRTCNYLPANTIIISKDLAIKLNLWKED